MKVVIEVEISEAEMNALSIIDQANQSDGPINTKTELEAKFGKNMLDRLESIGMFDWEYVDFMDDVMYTISNLGYKTLSAAIQSGIMASPGEKYLKMESQYDPDMQV